MLLTVSKASGVASSSGMLTLYFFSRKRFRLTMLKLSTIPLEMSEAGGVYGQTTRTYSCSGDELSATVDVTQSVLYEVPAPEDIVTTRTVDAWGNVLGTCLGGGQCLRRSTVTWRRR